MKQIKKYKQVIAFVIMAVAAFFAFDGCQGFSNMIDPQESDEQLQILADSLRKENQAYKDESFEFVQVLKNKNNKIEELISELDNCESKPAEKIYETITEYIPKLVAMECPESSEEAKQIIANHKEQHNKLLDVITAQGLENNDLKGDNLNLRNQLNKANEKKTVVSEKIFVAQNVKLTATNTFTGELQSDYSLFPIISESDFEDVIKSKSNRNILGASISLYTDLSDFSDQYFTGVNYQRITGKKERFVWGANLQTNFNSDFNYQKWILGVNAGIRF